VPHVDCRPVSTGTSYGQEPNPSGSGPTAEPNPSGGSDSGLSRTPGTGHPRPRVLVLTEGTYPFIVGGVSTWCDSLVTGLHDVDFSVLPLTAGGVRREACFSVPPNTRLAGHLDLWSEDVPLSVPRQGLSLRRTRGRLPSALAEGLLGWDSDLEAFVAALLWCRRHPRQIRAAFRSRRSWLGFVQTLDELTKRSAPDHASAPAFDMFEVAELYRLLWWIARCASYPTPDGEHAPDLCMVTAAGWAAIPAVVHKALHRTPILLTEHGIYVREAYLAAIRNGASPASRWTASRVARGLSRLAYAYCDRVSPVTQANAVWEEEFGVLPDNISTIYNGVVVPSRRKPAPRNNVVVAVGRIDPLKDIKTMLRTAARVVESNPAARFIHYGPIPPENQKYADECVALHAELGLGAHFVFAGSTDDPYGVVSRADIALLTSMSEGSPITVLEAMASGRPVVATAVGGVPEAVRGCGFTARPGDHESLAAGIVRLLDQPDFSESLGRLAYARASEVFGHANSLANYRNLIGELTNLPPAPGLYPHTTVPGQATEIVLTAETALSVEPDVGDHSATPRPSSPAARPTDGSRR
jgi:polysaccharide biosynthesis protein PelF